MSTTPTESAAEGAAIRRLSQYRPFEQGGISAREAKEDLIVATLAESGGSCGSISECMEHMATLWTLTYENLELADPLSHLIKAARVTRDYDGVLSLSENERQRLDDAAKVSHETETTAMSEWHESIRQRWPALTDAECQQLDGDLRAFLETLARQHGAEAALLAYPDDPAAHEMLAKANIMVADFDGESYQERRDWAIAMFMREASDSQRAYVATTVNTAYFVAALTIDPQGAKLVQELIAGQRVYLDTNFIYRLLGVQGPRYVAAAECILRVTQAAGYTCAVTQWTLDEYRTSLERSREFLERYPLPPDEFAAVAADAVSVEDFVTSYWRQVRSTRLDVNDYLAHHFEVETHLKDRGIAVIHEGIDAVDKQTERIAAETVLLEGSLGERYRHPRSIEHDVKHRLLVRRLRGDGNRTFANAGYWFLTHDKVLPRYDMAAEAEEDRPGAKIQFCVSAGAWFQVVQAFQPKTADISQTLADVVSSPFIHPRTPVTRRTAQAVAARVALYKDSTPELAARLFMNSAAMAQIEHVQTSKEQMQLIDKAIVASAREAQEEAQAVLTAATADRKAAALSIQEAENREREAEQLHRQELERVEEERRQATLNEQARADEAAKNAEERAGRELHLTRSEYESKLREKDLALEQERLRAGRAKRRVRLAIAIGVLALLFVVGALAGVFDEVWQYFVAVAVLVGFFVAVDQFTSRRDS